MPSIAWIWLAAFLIFLILELVTPTLMFLGFALGALISGVVSLFYPDAYYWQIGIFIAVAVIVLPMSRKLAKKITKESPQKSNIDALIGKVALVTKAIDSDLGGQVLFEGEHWRAVADENIETNTKVLIKSVAGTKLHVERN
jgi:membrane protein implicated in regulation of membrane protease activity